MLQKRGCYNIMKNRLNITAILLSAVLLVSGCSDENRSGVAAAADTEATEEAGDIRNGIGLNAFKAQQEAQTSAKEKDSTPNSPIEWFAAAENKGNYTVMKVETSKGIEEFKLSTFKEQLLAMDTPTKLQTSNRVTACDESGIQIVYTEKDDGGVSIGFCDVEVLKAAMDDSFCQVLHSKSTFFDMHMGTTTEYLTLSERSMEEVDSDIKRSGCYKSVNDGFTVTAYTNGGYTFYFILDVEAKLLNKGSEKTTEADQSYDSGTQEADTTLSVTDEKTDEPFIPVVAESFSDFTYNSGRSFPDENGKYIQGIQITGLANENANIINIPESILGDPVLDIDANAFEGNKKIVEVNLPKELLSIRSYAFKNCTSLEKVTMGEKINNMGDGVFSGCSKLVDINLPDNIIVRDEAFMNCKELSEINVGDRIGKSAFKGCSNLKKIQFHNQSKEGEIYDKAFVDCVSIEEIILPESITNIGESAFEGCSSLKKVSMNNKYINVGTNAFYGCDSLVDVDLGEEVRNIGIKAFANCTSLEKIELPSIDEYYDDHDKGVRCFREGMFMGCTSLKTIVFPEKYTFRIPNLAFSNCTSLEKVVIPDSCFKIGESAFEGCTSLSEVRLPVLINRGVESRAFRDCASLKSISFASSKSYVIGEAAFENCTGLTELKISGNYIDIYGSAFKGCTGLSKIDIVLEDKCSLTIGKEAFADCTGLTSVDLPEGVDSIGEDSFARCISLRNISIPLSADKWKKYSWLGGFTDCENITVIYKGESYSYRDLISLKDNMG